MCFLILSNAAQSCVGDVSVVNVSMIAEACEEEERTVDLTESRFGWERARRATARLP